MIEYPQIEGFLKELDTHLQPLPVSRRADILMEIKTHFEEMAQEAGRDIDEIIAEMGPAREVAQRYLSEYGLTVPAQKSNSIIAKMIYTILYSIGGVFVFILLIGALLLWKFTPLMEVTDDTVRFLGGAIHVANGAKKGSNSLSFNKRLIATSASRKSGTLQVSNAIKSLNIKFQRGRVTIIPTNRDVVFWRGTFQEELNVLAFTSVQGEQATLTLPSFKETRLAIPHHLAVQVTGEKGSVRIEGRRQPVTVTLDKGNITFKPAKESTYKYQTTVQEGKNELQAAKSDPKGIPIVFKVTKGNIIDGRKRVDSFKEGKK